MGGVKDVTEAIGAQNMWAMRTSNGNDGSVRAVEMEEAAHRGVGEYDHGGVDGEFETGREKLSTLSLCTTTAVGEEYTGCAPCLRRRVEEGAQGDVGVGNDSGRPRYDSVNVKSKGGPVVERLGGEGRGGEGRRRVEPGRVEPGREACGSTRVRKTQHGSVLSPLSGRICKTSRIRREEGHMCRRILWDYFSAVSDTKYIYPLCQRRKGRYSK